MPSLGDNAVPHLGRLLTKIGRGLPCPDPEHLDLTLIDRTLSVLVPEPGLSLTARLGRAMTLHPLLAHVLPPLAGTTMAPTMLQGSAARNVMPARAWADLDCRVLPGTTRGDVEREVRARLGEDHFDLEWPEEMIPGSSSPADGILPDAIAACLGELDPQAHLLPMLCTGYTDSSYLRRAGDTAAYGFSPFLSTPAHVLAAGYHNADERVHVDDLVLSAGFHVALAKRMLG